MAESPTQEEMEAFIDAFGAHNLYNRKTRKCVDGTDWCTDYYLKAMMPEASAGAMLLWPAYLGARLWIGIFVAIPWIFGFRFKVVVVDGVARSRFVRKSNMPHDMPATKAPPAKAPAKAPVKPTKK